MKFGLPDLPPGLHSVRIAELTEQFRVLRPAQIELSALSVDPAQVRTGERVAVAVEVTNSGEVGKTYEALLFVDGDQVDAAKVRVAPGATETVDFSIQGTEAGDFDVGIGNAEGRFKVLSPAIFVFTDLEVSPVSVEVGQTASVRVFVTNEGEVDDTRVVPLNASGLTVESAQVSLGAGATRQLDFEFTPSQDGSYVLEIGGQSATLEVLVPEEDGSTTTLVIAFLLVLAILAGGSMVVWRFRGSFSRSETSR